MINKEEQLTLDDIMDRRLVQYLLGLVSSYIGCASFTMSSSHKETYAVNSTNFCDNVFRKTECGTKACEECDAKHCKEAAEKREAVLYKCHNGIYTSAIPVFVGKNYLGAIMCGQVLFEEPDLEFCKQKAKEYGIDEKEYIEAYKQIPIVNEEKFKEAIAQTEKFCKATSNLATAKILEQQQQNKADFVITLLNAINNKKDLNETILSLLANAAELLNVDRIIIENFFEGTSQVEVDYFTPNKVSNDVIEAIQKLERETWVTDAWQNETETKGLIYFDDIYNSTLEPKLKGMYSKLGLRSALGAIIKTNNEPKLIVIEKFNNPHTWTRKEKSFLKIVAKELTTAITQAKLRKDLEHQLFKLRTLINNMPFELWMKDIDGKYLAVNDLWLKNNHLKKDAVIGKYDNKFLSAENLAKYKTMCARILETKEEVYEEVQEVCKNKIYWYINYLCPILDNQENIIAFVGSKRDITHQKETDKLKTEFISTVSHEIRTPLTSIISGLGLAMSGVLGELPQKIKDALELSERNSQRLLTVINDILDIEKLSAGKVEYTYQIVELNKVIENSIKKLQDFAIKYNVKVNYNENACKDLSLNVDEFRFVQILTNLLSNAIKFTENNRDVEIVVNDLPDDKVRISVVNYGAEVPEEYKTKIYGKFVQVDPTVSREKNGAGLGLSIAYQLTKDMNGTIDYISRNGKTVFFIEFDKVI